MSPENLRKMKLMETHQPYETVRKMKHKVESQLMMRQKTKGENERSSQIPSIPLLIGENTPSSLNSLHALPTIFPRVGVASHS
jgi:hypothetical protein